MTAYDSLGGIVAKQELSYHTPPVAGPRESDLYGDLGFTGDASAAPGQPGNWIWNVSGNGIVKVMLEFGVGHDPAIAFDLLSFTTECPQACSPNTVTPDLSNLVVGQSVEGLGVIAPGLNIDAKGTAVKLLPLMEPAAYASIASTGPAINGNIIASGAFTDIPTKNALQPHSYTFTFAPGMSISQFSLHMLDFGDWNPTATADHYVSMTAYDSLGGIVAKQELSYHTPPVAGPRESDLYGDLGFTGDASAAPGQPGNWTWNVNGAGIVKVILEFGVGHDPAIAFDLLSFTTECP
jgi:hypothetical protein